MPYQLKYTTRFQSLKENGNIYELNISVKDYEGDSQQIILGENPVVQNWQDDDPLKPIKGCVLNINIINDGTISLDDFYSDEDDKFLVSFQYIDTINPLNSKELFQGFVIQDDCSEIMVDYNHYIQLSATDNLGILKNTTIFDASINAGSQETRSSLSINGFNDGINNSLIFNSENYLYPFTKILPTTKITISNTGIYDGTYTVLSVVPDSNIPQLKIIVKENITNTATASNAILSFNLPIDLNQFLSLRDLVRMCLFATKLRLPLKVVSVLKIVGNNKWLDDTYIDGTSLNQNGTYITCYNLLESLMQRFNASLFQSNNYKSITLGHNVSWYIVRFAEFPLCQDYTDVKMYAIQYDNNIVFDYYYEEKNFIEYNSLNQIETGAIKSFERPYNYTLEKFDYNFKSNLLNNGDLLTLGDLVETYNSGLPGAPTIYYYTAPYWEINNSISRPLAEVRIVVWVDQYGNEIERYLRIKYFGPMSIAQQQDYLVTNRIAVKKGDIIKVSFDYEEGWYAADNQDYQRAFGHYIEGTGPTYEFVNYGRGLNNPKDGSWTPTGYVLLVIPENTLPNLKTFSYTTEPAPIDGEFRFSLSVLGDLTTGITTKYKNIKVEISSTEIGKSVVGHTHKTLSNSLIKNFLEKDINLDSSPSQSISYTLVSSEGVGVQRNIATIWDYDMPCSKTFQNVEFYFGSEHPISGDRVILITSNNIPSGFNVNDYSSGSSFTITNSTNGANGTYTIAYIQIIAFVAGLPLLYIATVEPQPFVETLGTGDFTFVASPKTGSLGELTTFEDLFLRWKPRIKIDCNLITLHGTNTSNFILSLISIMQIDGFQYLWFLIGSLAIDYKKDTAQCTLYGYINENESIEDLEAVSSYEFKYLYKNS